MNSEKYTLTKSEEFLTYYFFSEGPKGIIRKAIVFQLIDSENSVYNLAFGDWNDQTRNINDRIVSNNRDMRKVLATVSYAVVDFMRSNASAIIFAEGSTMARNRLYQMSISLFWEEIKSYYELLGYLNGAWESYKINTNYDAFLLSYK